MLACCYCQASYSDIRNIKSLCPGCVGARSTGDGARVVGWQMISLAGMRNPGDYYKRRM